MSDYDPPSNVGIGTRLWVKWKNYDYVRVADSVEAFAGDWCEHEIIGETRVSWIARPVGLTHDYADKKIAKRSLTISNGPRVRWSLDGIAADYADALWAQKNRYRIHDAMLRLDVPTLRKVAALIGYEEAK